LALVFRKFDEVGSVRQVTLWLREEKIELPAVGYGPQGRIAEWHLPRYNMVHRILTNPIYAGAYVFGRTGSHIKVEDGRKVIKRGIRRDQAAWEVLIRDHHVSYITWEQYIRNQRLIGENANMKGAMVAGSVRNGGGVLVGLLRCGHCGRKLRVYHNGLRGVARYVCSDASINHGIRDKCIAFGNMRIDAAVAAEVMRVISPVAIEAALDAVAEYKQANTDRIGQITLSLEQARYEADRARRQYDAVEPENRNVVTELERRWNERLAAVARLEDDIRLAQEAQPASSISTEEQAQLLALAEDLPRAWNHVATTVEIRKRLLRTVLEEIVVTAGHAHLSLKLHWKGGEHTALEVPRTRPGQHRWKTSKEVEQLICELARQLPDYSIAAVLNRLGMRSAKGLTWTQLRIRNFRAERGMAIYREGERSERGELILEEVATHLGISKTSVIRLIKQGILPATQTCPGAPYVIRRDGLDRSVVRSALANGRAVTYDERQNCLIYQ
jgi:hypothetical protein